MQHREKILLIVFLSALGLLCGYWLVDSFFVSPWHTLAKARATVETDIANQEKIIGRRPQYESDWRNLGSATYATDPSKVPLEVRSQVWPLLERDGGLSPEGVTPLINPRQPDSRDKTFSLVPAEIHGRGQLDNVLSSIYLLGENPRLGVLRRVVIEPVPQRGSSRVDRGVDKNATYRLTLTYATLWMNQTVSYTVDDKLRMPRLDSRQWKKDWGELASTTMFGRYTPPPPPPTPAPTPTPPVATPTPPTPTPTPPPPPPAGRDLAVTGIYETTGPSGREVYVSVLNTAKNTRSKVKEGGELADGVIVAIHIEERYIVMEAKGKKYAVEVRANKTVADRVPLEQYKPIRPLSAAWQG